MTDSAQNIEKVFAYHRLSKHHLRGFADSPGYLDWANQPNPFRTFAGAPALDLPLLADALNTSYAECHVPGAVTPRRADVNSVAVLFELSLGLSAWKEHQRSRWALRCNPSSGNLHPTESYAILPALPGVEAGVYHYESSMHRLERRCTVTLEGTGLPSGCFLVGLSSIHWRESWKYGVRAFRYCQHDLGHALAAVRYAAAALGWSALLLDHLGDEEIAHWLGLDRSSDYASVDALDREHPGALLLIGPPTLPAVEPALHALDSGTWMGTANQLSPSHVSWEGIAAAADASRKPRTPLSATFSSPLPPLAPSRIVPAAALIRQRRSCLALDGQTSIDAATFYAILDHLLPRQGVPPWDMLPWRPLIHPAIFVHRVRGLTPGLYLLERSPEVHDSFTAEYPSTLLWRRPAGCPEHLAFYLLTEGDFRETARTVSCHQEIASDGAFSLGMLAEFGETIRARGPWWYRRMFWESGVLGQVLYLEAEAAGVRGTGIGCYFDDAFHRLLGLKGDNWQDLYHFTIGGPVEDKRLRTLAPYSHLAGR